MGNRKFITETELSSVYNDRFIDVSHATGIRPDGEEGTYTVIRSGSGFGGVVVLRSVSRGVPYYALVHQHRYPVGEFTFEFPRGETGDLSAVEAAQELVEETGIFFGGTPVHLGNIYPDSGLLSTEVAVWLFTRTVKFEDLQTDYGYEEPESGATVRWVDGGNLTGMIRNGQIKDGMTVAAYGLLKASGLEAIAY